MKILAYSYLGISHLIYIGTIYAWWELMGQDLVAGFSELVQNDQWEELKAYQFHWSYMIYLLFPFMMIFIMVASWWFVDTKRSMVMWLNSIPLFCIAAGVAYIVVLFNYVFS